MSNSKELEANKEVVREFFLRREKGDPVGAFALYSDDGQWCSPRGGPSIAPQVHAENMRWFLGQMKDGIRFDFGVFTAEDDRVALTLESHASLVNGKEYNQIYHKLFELRDGEIRRSWEYADSLHTMESLEGLTGVPSAPS